MRNLLYYKELTGGVIGTLGHETPRPVRVKAPAGTKGSINRKALSAIPFPLCRNYRGEISVCIQCLRTKRGKVKKIDGL